MNTHHLTFFVKLYKILNILLTCNLIVTFSPYSITKAIDTILISIFQYSVSKDRLQKMLAIFSIGFIMPISIIVVIKIRNNDFYLFPAIQPCTIFIRRLITPTIIYYLLPVI